MLMEHGARPKRAHRFAVCLANARARIAVDDLKPEATSDAVINSTCECARQRRRRLRPSDDATIAVGAIDIGELSS